MFTLDMARCPGCQYKDGCKNRLLIVQQLSPLTNTLNTDPEHFDGPGDGIIIVACQYGLNNSAPAPAQMDAPVAVADLTTKTGVSGS